jgi:hypothetical protein
MAKKARARKCTAEIVGNIQVKIEATQAFDFFFCNPTGQEQSPTVHQIVCGKSSKFCWYG